MPWNKLTDVPDNLREIQGGKLTLAQVNQIAEVADALEREGKVGEPWGVAIAQFKKTHVLKDGRWLTRAKDMNTMVKAVLSSVKADESDKEAQKKRSAHYGIGIKDGGHVTKPSEFADVPDDMFGDPVNYRYPADKAHIQPAVAYFNHDGQMSAGGYSAREWAIIGKRIASHAKGKVYKGGKIVDTKSLSFIKALPDGRWVGWFTNAFEDREEEYFATRAIEQFVDYFDKEKPDLPLWYWHIPIELGKAEWVGLAGRIAVAAGHLSPVGLKFAAYYKEHPEEQAAMSHGFYWSPDKYTDSTYEFFVTKEVTLLPEWAAANEITRWGAVEEKMAVTEQKKAELARIVGEDAAKELLEEALAKSKELEEAGVKFKEAEAPPPEAEPDAEPKVEGAEPGDEAPEAPAPESKEAAPAATEPQTMRMVIDESTIEALAEAVAAKIKPADLAPVVKALEAQNEALKELLKSDEQKVKERLANLPKLEIFRASQAGEKETAKVPTNTEPKWVNPLDKSLQDGLADIQKARQGGS